MELDDLIAELDQFGTELEQVTETSLAEIARTLPNKLRGEIFSKKKSRSGTLSPSIRAVHSGNTLSFGMVYYGFYQVFGANGTSLRGAFGLPDTYKNALPPSSGNKYQFRKILHPGIAGVSSAYQTLLGIEDLIVESLIEE